MFKNIYDTNNNGKVDISETAEEVPWAGITDKPAIIAAGADAAAARGAIGAEPTISEGTTEQYWRGDKTWRDFATDVRATALTGLSTATNAVITATDTVLTMAGKLQKQISDHFAATSGAHAATAISNTPAGGIAATNVQAAINELDSEKLPKSGGTMTGDLSVPSLNGGQLAGFRNKIINGKMDISQRNGETVMFLTDTPTYFNDRWSCVSSTTPSGSLLTGRTTIVGALGVNPLGDGFSSCLYFQRQSGTYAGSAKAIQVLETVESRSLAGRTVTLSFWTAVNTGWLGGNLTAAVLTGTGTDQTAAQFFAGSATAQATAGSVTITPTGTLTKYSLQATIPAGATQVAVLFQNAGWTGTGTSLDIIAITGVQLEVGSVATPFEHRPYSVELALCQRYYEVCKTVTLRNQFHTGFVYQWFTFTIQKRAIPTCVLYNTSYTNAAGAVNNAASITGVELAVSASSAGGLVQTDFSASAEL